MFSDKDIISIKNTIMLREQDKNMGIYTQNTDDFWKTGPVKQ